MAKNRLNLACALLLALMVGCSNGNKPQPDASTKRSERPAQEVAAKPVADQSAAAQPDATAPAPPPGPAGRPAGDKLPDPLRGKVKETMGAGGYTYVLLATDHGDVWAAARAFQTAVGDEVEIGGFMPMRNFSSPSLKREFDVIQFAGAARVVGAGASVDPGSAPRIEPGQLMPANHPPIEGVGATTKSAPPTSMEPGEIAALADGVTVAHLIENKADLAGKAVKFRGRVVKANRGIMGKNWMHIQDGTGAPGSNDITVTSVADFAPKGSLVIIEGTLALDQDFGAGYRYDVIVQDAKVALEQPEPETP